MTTNPAGTFTPTRSNMVQRVYNIIEGYQSGPNRALAQDPPQNSLDAGNARPVRVRYPLHPRRVNGTEMVILTVTDSNTTGLRGPALTDHDLELRAAESGHLELTPEENWAAWEAMDYTKVDEDDLGSRGQGKAAFLFHSAHASGLAAGGRALERMVILYDTLLEDGTYRLGVRLANPDDTRFTPPLAGEEARRVIQNSWEHDSLQVPLGRCDGAVARTDMVARHPARQARNLSGLRGRGT